MSHAEDSVTFLVQESVAQCHAPNQVKRRAILADVVKLAKYAPWTDAFIQIVSVVTSTVMIAFVWAAASPAVAAPLVM